MLLFHDNGLDPAIGELIKLGNVFLEPAFKIIQIGLFHDNKMYPYSGYFTNFRCETVEMGVPQGNRRALDPRRT